MIINFLACDNNNTVLPTSIYSIKKKYSLIENIFKNSIHSLLPIVQKPCCMCSGARGLSFICRGLCVNYDTANTWEMCSRSISFWSDTRGLHSKGTAESDRGVCTIQAALSQASLGMPEVQNNRPSSNFTLRMVKSSSHSGMHRCRHSAAVNPSKHSLCLILCGVNATGRLLWACVCCIWVSHSK